MSSERAPRLPGFRFETQAPPLPEVLPRMDIAAFVGLRHPVPCTTCGDRIGSSIHGIYGDDDSCRGTWRRRNRCMRIWRRRCALFSETVGGVCWAVRVARESAKQPGRLNRARYNYFPIPGLARAEFDGGGRNLKRIAPGFARARSEGSWSDSLKVSAAMLTDLFS